MDLNDVNVIGWPSNSPDINIIENVWAYVQDKLFDVRDQIRSPNETWERVQQIWEEISLAYIQDLYLDLPERMKELVENKGGPISH